MKIREMLERFMAGETTVDEEKQMSRYFREHPIVDDDLEPYRQMFKYFDAGMPLPYIGESQEDEMATGVSEAKTSSKRKMNGRWIWYGVAAALIGCVLFVGVRSNGVEKMHVDSSSEKISKEMNADEDERISKEMTVVEDDRITYNKDKSQYDEDRPSLQGRGNKEKASNFILASQIAQSDEHVDDETIMSTSGRIGSLSDRVKSRTANAKARIARVKTRVGQDIKKKRDGRKSPTIQRNVRNTEKTNIKANGVENLLALDVQYADEIVNQFLAESLIAQNEAAADSLVVQIEMEQNEVLNRVYTEDVHIGTILTDMEDEMDKDAEEENIIKI